MRARLGAARQAGIHAASAARPWPSVEKPTVRTDRPDGMDAVRYASVHTATHRLTVQTALLLPESNALTSGYVLQDTSVAAVVRYTSVRPGFQEATDRRTPGHGRPGWERLR